MCESFVLPAVWPPEGVLNLKTFLKLQLIKCDLVSCCRHAMQGAFSFLCCIFALEDNVVYSFIFFSS